MHWRIRHNHVCKGEEQARVGLERSGKGLAMAGVRWWRQSLRKRRFAVTQLFGTLARRNRHRPHLIWSELTKHGGTLFVPKTLCGVTGVSPFANHKKDCGVGGCHIRKSTPGWKQC